MENVLTALFAVFLILLAVLILSHGFIASVDGLQVSWQAMQTRLDDQMGTHLSPVSAHVHSSGQYVSFTSRNDGSQKLADFDRWDVLVQYTDASGDQHVDWLPYRESPGGWSAGWQVDGLYTPGGDTELYEPDVLNPGEEVVLHIYMMPFVGAGEGIQIVIATPSGSTTAFFTQRNIPPQQLTNAGITLMSHSSADITDAHLHATDADDSADELVYTVRMPPEQGTLNLGATFTQADIDAGLLSYTHTGLGDDSFMFDVSDGEDSIGTYTFHITTTNMPPVLTTNNWLTVAAGSSVVIDSNWLEVTDPDDLPQNLVYTITTAPVQGTLNLGATFTQADLNGGLVQYAHTGFGNDSFQFTVSDGEVVIGIFVFNIAVM